MATCQQGVGVQECKTHQILEPDSTLITATMSGGVDLSLDEHGDEPLGTDQSVVSIEFQAAKAGDYRFEYLYVDAFGVQNPGNVAPVIQNMTLFGFDVNLAGLPIVEGHILRWRAVVVDTGLLPTPIDTPEELYLQLNPAPTFIAYFHVPRSTMDYGFTELRVENMIDPPEAQTPIIAQVVDKQFTNFTVALSPTPPTGNYYLTVRTP